MGMKAVSVFTLALVVLAATRPARASLLVNGNFDSTGPADDIFEVYYDGSTPSVADDVPGWLLFLGEADGSWIEVNQGVSPSPPNVYDVDMGIGPSGGGLMTAPGSRPAVTPGLAYFASCTADNYNNGTGSAFFIDWFDASGALISSTGGGIGDPSGNGTFVPYTQTFTINGIAPALAALAGVRFTSGNSNFNGLAADNFTFAVVPEPEGLALVGLCAAAALRRRRRGAASRVTAWSAESSDIPNSC
jgi:MYXO-CTERM domain-containing protein